MRLEVKYWPKGSEVDVELDRKLQAAIETVGFRWTGQGYDYEEKARDIQFESKEGESHEKV